MSPIIILIISIVLVVAGILVCKLHAFLALLLAALVAAFLTSESALDTYAVDEAEKSYTNLFGDGPDATTTQQEYERTKATYVAKYKTQFKKKSAMARVAEGFGSTCGKIGILIAMASIIGKCMLDSGSADRIVRTVLKRLGQKNAGVAFMGSGFLLSIPVFFDTVFYLMIPLAKATRIRVGKNYVLYIMAIVAGGSMAHSLVPPTPGPLIVAEEFNVSLISMIIAGCCVGLCSSVAGLTFAAWRNKTMEVPLRDSADAKLEDLEAQTQKDDSELPSFFVSLLPIILPVLLIAAATATDTYYKNLTGGQDSAQWIDSIKPVVKTLGDKNIALILAGVIAMATLISRPGTDRKKMATAIGGALASGGIIILITSAGGGFGSAIRQSGIKEVVAGSGGDVATLGTLVMAFSLTTLIRTAQGSSTVAMITVASIFAPLALEPELLPYHPVYLALAVGCGSKPIAWMADSGFWVICKMSGMTEAEGLRTITPMSIVMGIVGLIATLLGAMLFPLI
ncbi:MAG: gluconate transporter [Planctomycetaceae bacterium]|nr:gluconate transporter [Planctomycetaceae bacterium]